MKSAKSAASLSQQQLLDRNSQLEKQVMTRLLYLWALS